LDSAVRAQNAPGKIGGSSSNGGAECEFQLGHRKDYRPDLPQLKIALSTLDPLGLPMTITTVAGNTADDPLYRPEIAKVRQSVGQTGMTYIGDCKTRL